MTTLKERLRADLITNLKARNTLETTTLRNILGAITSVEKSGKMAVEFGDAEVSQLLAREVKKREATASEYTAAAEKLPEGARRTQLLTTAAQERAEIAVIEVYLPQALTRDEVAALVTAAVARVSDPTPKMFGAIMKDVIVAAAGRADGKLVSELVREQLTA